jgi:hypothetical protein
MSQEGASLSFLKSNVDPVDSVGPAGAREEKKDPMRDVRASDDAVVDRDRGESGFWSSETSEADGDVEIPVDMGMLQAKSCETPGTDGEEGSSGTPVCRAEDDDFVWKIFAEDGDLRLVLQGTFWLPGLEGKPAKENVD